MKLKNTFLLSIVLFLMIISNQKITAQTPGLIYENQGISILDPNGDGFVSQDIFGFSSNDLAESEIAYTPIPVLEIEPDSDPVFGPDCAYNDIVGSASEAPVLVYYDETNERLFFRFRLGGTASNAKGYSILVDSDQKFGFTGSEADPNAKIGNPGFEFEIVLETGYGVALYDTDGLAIANSVSDASVRPYADFAQKSIAHSTICGDPDYFYDFYVPISNLSVFGVNGDSYLRFVGATVMDHTAFIGSSFASDIAGTDENYFGDIFECIPPIRISEIGTANIECRTSCPTINGPIAHGATTVSGTSIESDGTVIEVFVNGSPIGTTTVSGGTWSIAATLVSGDIVTATAKAGDRYVSFDDCDIEIVECSPVLTSLDIFWEGLCGEDYISGASLKVYHNGIEMQEVGDTIFTDWANGDWTFNCNNSSGCDNGDGNCMERGWYDITQEEPGSCESKCVGIHRGDQLSAVPVINQNPIYTDTDPITGTGVDGATIILYQDSLIIETAIVNSSGNWSISPSVSLTACSEITARQVESGRDGSGLTTPIIVLSTDKYYKPVITGNYCVLAGPVTTVTGTSVEKENSVIDVLVNGGSVGTTLVTANGTWELTSLTINIGDIITAQVINGSSCISKSDLSDAITVTQATVNNTSITAPITEGAPNVTGNGTAGSIATLYMDGVAIGTHDHSPNTWFITNLNDNPDTKLYAGGVLTVTESDGTNCESNHSTPGIIIECNPPTNNLTLSSVQTEYCKNENPQIIVVNPDPVTIYTPILNSDNSVIGFSEISNAAGDDLILTLADTISPSTIVITVKAIKLSSLAVPCESINTNSVSLQINSLPDDALAVSPAITSICRYESVDITITAAENNVTYQLQNNSTGTNIGSSAVGDGSDLTINTGPLVEDITIKVNATDYTHPITNCSVDLINIVDITVTGALNDQIVTVDDVILCQNNSTNVNVTTNNDGFLYQIKNSGGFDVGTAFTGNGNSHSRQTLNLTTGEKTFYVEVTGAGCTISVLDDATVTVNDCFTDIHLTKTVNDNTPDEGDEIIFTITVTNNGPLDVTNLIVTDNLPIGLTHVSGNTSTGTWNNPSWDIGNLNSSTSATLTINATVDVGTSGDLITNTASKTHYETDNTATDDYEESVTVTSTAELKVTTNGLEHATTPTDIVYTVELNFPNNTGSPITFDFDDTGTGTALSGTDYTAVNGAAQITVADGALIGTITISVIDDLIYELTETVICEISNSSEPAVSITTTSASANIVSNESAPTVTLSASPLSIAETGETSTITATLSIATYQDVIVNLSYSGSALEGTDYNAAAASITITAGSLTGTVDITTVNDNIYEEDETVIADITTVTGGGASENGVQTVSVTITSEESAPFVTLSALPLSIAETGETSTLTATLDVITYQDVSVNLLYTGDAVNGTDYNAIASITILAGNFTGTTDITTVDDFIYELNEDVIVDIDNVTGGGAAENGIQSVTVTITSNESAPFVTLSALPLSIAETGETSTLTASLSGITYEDVIVDLSYSGDAINGTDYNAVTSITITAGNTTGTTDITTVDDLIYELSEDVIVDIDNVTGGGAVESGTQSETVIITSNESAPSVTLSALPLSIAETGEISTLTASLNIETYEDVTVNLLYSGSALEGTDYNTSASITIVAGSLSGTTDITSVNDDIYEDNETVIADISNVTGGGASETGTQTVTVTINDDADIPRVTISALPLTIAETVETSILTATLSNATYQDVTVNLLYSGSAIEGTDYTANALITVTAGNLFGTTGITTVDDDIYEIDETVITDINTIIGGGAIEDGGQTVTVTITSEESAPKVTLSASTPVITENPVSTSTLTATLDVLTYQDVIVNLTYTGTAINVTDYSAAGAITISAGSLTGTTDITSEVDLLFEADETVITDINTITGGDATEDGTQNTTVTITDAETADALLSVTNGNDEDPLNIVYTVSLNKANNTGQTIIFGFNDLESGTATRGTDYTTVDGAAQILIADGSASGTITIQVTQDFLFEADETINAQITTCNNSDVIFNTDYVPATIIDNETPDANLNVTTHGIEDATTPTHIVYTLTLTRDNNTGSPITFEFDDIGSGTATSGTDYTPVDGAAQIIIAEGTDTGTISIQVLDDDLFESTETVVCQITSCSNGDVMNLLTPATADISDNESINATLSVDTHGQEDETTPTDIVYIVEFDKTNNTGSAITFDFTDIGNVPGTATSGDDYTEVNGAAQISVPDNSSIGTITIPVIDDLLFEADETINAQITACSDADVNFTIEDVTANIIDNETVTADLSVTTHGDENGPVNIVYTVTLSSDNNTGSDITFEFDDLETGTALSGIDYTAVDGTTQITIADGAISGTITIDVDDDSVFETTETVIAQISLPSNDDVTINTNIATANILDNETADADLSVTTHGDENGPQNIVYTVTLNPANNTGSAITFDFDDIGGSATSGDDYTAIPSDATISVANGTDFGIITIPVTDDVLLEITETLIAQISNSSNGSVTITPASASATADIIDNEAPTADLSVTTHGDENGPVDIVYTATISNVNSTGTAITFDFEDLLGSGVGTATTGIDYATVSAGAQITINDGESFGNIIIPVIDNVFFEPTETVDCQISNASNLNVTIEANTATANIFDDDYADIVLTKTVDNNAPNEGDNIIFTITVTNNGPYQITNLIVTDDLPVGLTLVSAIPSVGSWTDPDWNVGTLETGNSETLIVTATVDIGTNGYDIINTISNTQTQYDDNTTSDDDNETINVNDIPVANDDTEIVDEDGILVNDVLINDTGLTDGGIVVTVTTDVINGILELNTDGTYTYTPNADYHGSDSFVYQVCDMSGDCDQATVNITVNSVNDLPIAQDDDINIDEDSELNELFILEENGYGTDYFGGDGPNTETIYLISGTQNGTLEFNDNGTPVDPTDDYFSYTPERNYFGSDSFEYEICDSDGDCDQAVVNIEVINDGVLFIPEVFTPNGDGFNDYFVIEGLELYPESLIIIFNRWGNKVFEASPYNNDWDGSANFGIIPGGNELSEGTYFFIIKTNNEQKELKGSIYLKK